MFIPYIENIYKTIRLQRETIKWQTISFKDKNFLLSH